MLPLKRTSDCLDHSDQSDDLAKDEDDQVQCAAATPTYVARLFHRFGECLEKLGVDTKSHACLRKMEHMAIFVHESMSISARNYHSVQHVFDISNGMTDPLPILAALFHDCIYYQVDGAFSASQADKLKGAIVAEENSTNCLVARGSKKSEDVLLHMVLSIFGFEPGQQLAPSTGLNEFLSAVIAVRELQHLLSRRQLAEIACCIEATIPFRPTTDAEGSAMHRLYHKLAKTNQTFALKMKESDMVVAVQQAAMLANNDVANFGTEDIGYFLDNTWSLLPEANVSLRHQYLITVMEFQVAVFTMYGFFGFLQPSVIFQSFRGVPCDEEISRRSENAARNLEIGRRYVAAKLLSISVLAAMAELTGGDAPVSMFMGDLPTRGCVSIRLAELIPTLHEETVEREGKCDMEVYGLLLNGRKSESSFDIRQSPLAAYFYGILGDARVREILSAFPVCPMTLPIAESLLQSLPAKPVQTLAEKMCLVTPSRSPFLQELVERRIV